MHRLDNCINDIELRIEDVLRSIPELDPDSISLQESLLSYGWILLDSWIAWRTLRFLLKELHIDIDVHKKWFNTPSSYNASQLKAVWKFNESTLDFIENNTGKSLKYIIDSLIQPRRNESAHFSQQRLVNSSDYQEIRVLYKILSIVFLRYEIGSFVKCIEYKLFLKGYTKTIIFINDTCITASDFINSLKDFPEIKEFILQCEKDDWIYRIFFRKEGCTAGKQRNTKEIFQQVALINDEQAKYDFFKNKGFYRNIDLFLSTAEKCWNEVQMSI